MSRFALRRALLPVLLLGLVAACAQPAPSPTGSGNTEVATGGARFSTADAATAALGADVGPGVFPRTVTHARGTTRIEARPTRVVVLDTGELDDVLALGVTPVGLASPDGKVNAYQGRGLVDPLYGNLSFIGVILGRRLADDLNGKLWPRIPAVQGGRAQEVDDSVWFLGLGPTGANLVLDDLTRLLG